MHDYTTLSIEQQIELTKESIKISDAHIKHYSSNPIQLDELRYKIQRQGLAEHNKNLHNHLEKLQKRL